MVHTTPQHTKAPPPSHTSHTHTYTFFLSSTATTATMMASALCSTRRQSCAARTPPCAPPRVAKNLLRLELVHEKYMATEETKLRKVLAAFPDDVKKAAQNVFFTNATHIKTSGGWEGFVIVPASHLEFSDTSQTVGVPLAIKLNMSTRNTDTVLTFPTLAFLRDQELANRIIFPSTAPGAFTADTWNTTAQNKMVVLTGLVTTAPFNLHKALSSVWISRANMMTVVHAHTIECTGFLASPPTPLEVASSIIAQLA